MKALEKFASEIMRFRSNKKGEVQYIMMLGIGLIMLITLGYIQFPIISGVQNAITTPTGALGGAYGNYTNSVAGAITLFGVTPIILGAVIALTILMMLAVKK